MAKKKATGKLRTFPREIWATIDPDGILAWTDIEGAEDGEEVAAYTLGKIYKKRILHELVP